MEFLSRPVTFRVLAATIALLLGVGVIAAVTVEDDTDTLNATADTTTTTVEGTPPETVPDAAPGEPGGPPPTDPAVEPVPGQPAPGGPATTSAPPPAPPASAEPGAMAPTRAGLYRFKITTDGKEGRAELRVSDEAGAPAGEQRKLHRKTADGETTESSIAWRRNGVFERSRSFPGGGGACDWEPDVMLLARPLKAGSSWKWDSRCTSQINGQQADFHYTGQGQVTGAQRAAVGGRQVNVWAIQMTGKINITGTYQGQPFTVVVDIASDVQFAPEQGMTVRSDTTSKVTPPGQPTQEEHTVEELLNLDPA